ncbi:MAG: extracellular solute-binding protein [Mogibacterium sp.]|nr:extracellular solute-binding protein [Mogibacterium sp.]
MARTLFAVLLSLLMIGMMTGCTGEEAQASGAAAGAADGKTLYIWSWNADFRDRFNDYYPGVVRVEGDGSATTMEDGTVIQWVIVDEGDYQKELDQALAKQADGTSPATVDLFLVKAGPACKYVNSDVSLDIGEIGVENDPDDQYAYTRQVMTDADGKVKGVTWLADPGLMVYRRSIAEAVLKTDDPENVQEALKDWTNFEETAVQVDMNRYTMLSAYDDVFQAFSCNLKEPYVQDGKTLKVDDGILKWAELIKELADEGNVKGNKRNSAAWNEDMGEESDVFLWPLTVSEFSALRKNGVSGDFGLCQGPAGWTRGGMWILAANGTSDAALDAEIMTTMTTDPAVLKTLAIEEGDFVNSKSLVQELIEGDEGDEFFGGQETFAVLDAAASAVEMTQGGAYDQDINNRLRSAFLPYFTEEAELEEAQEAFEQSIRKLHPEIESVTWPE